MITGHVGALPTPDRPIRVLAVDLTSRPERTSAAAVLRSGTDGWRLLQPSKPLDGDAAILTAAKQVDLVALDGPRFPPRGFEGFVAKGEAPPGGASRSRSCEREHMRRICPIFFSSPVATAGVQAWMARSWRLFAALDQRPIEIYPMGAFVSMRNGVDIRRPHGLAAKTSRRGQTERLQILRALLGAQTERFADSGQGSEKRHDRLDATMGAVVAACHLMGLTVELGEPTDGTIVVPSLDPQGLHPPADG